MIPTELFLLVLAVGIMIGFGLGMLSLLVIIKKLLKKWAWQNDSK